MTRINVVPVEELCDQHLFAEFRELTRIPNGLVSGNLKQFYIDRPKEYTLGKGHVKFFTNKLSWLYIRYNELYQELKHRNYNVVYIWPDDAKYIGAFSWNGYQPDAYAIIVNRARIIERMPVKARWTNRKRPQWAGDK